MDESTFMRRFSDWEVAVGDAKNQYNAEDIPKYDELCSLYLEATPERRRRLTEMVVQGGNRVGNYRLGYLIYEYMRAISKRIRTPDDSNALRLGLAAAAIAERPIDWRDVVVSLAFLHHAAMQAGIDPAPYFREIADMASPETGKFIRGFLGRSDREIKDLVSQFSDPAGQGD
jgi:hypothetical protein